MFQLYIFLTKHVVPFFSSFFCHPDGQFIFQFIFPLSGLLLDRWMDHVCSSSGTPKKILKYLFSFLPCMRGVCLHNWRYGTEDQVPDKPRPQVQVFGADLYRPWMVWVSPLNILILQVICAGNTTPPNIFYFSLTHVIYSRYFLLLGMLAS